MTQVRVGKKVPPSFSLDLEFPIGPGILAFFGPAGAGKSLTLEMIAGFVAPDSGRILLDDAILYDAQTRVFLPPQSRRCGYVAQRDTLFPHMTLRQNLAFAARSLPRVERHRRIAELLDRFSLTAAAEARTRELAPKQRRDAAAARALIPSPRLVLLDDRGWDEAALRTIRETCPSPVVLVTGDLDLCCAVATELILMENGRLVQRGAPRVVVNRPESVEAAQLLGFPNVFAGTIGSLDPGRNTGRVDFETFALQTSYIPGHFRGDRISIAVHPADVRVHSGEIQPGVNFIPATLVRVSMRARSVRMEFAGGLFADLSHPDYAARKDNKSWLLEFPPEGLKIL